MFFFRSLMRRTQIEKKKNVIWRTIIFGENCSRLLISFTDCWILKFRPFRCDNAFEKNKNFSWSHLTKSSTSLQQFELQCFMYVCHSRPRYSTPMKSWKLYRITSSEFLICFQTFFRSLIFCYHISQSNGWPFHPSYHHLLSNISLHFHRARFDTKNVNVFIILYEYFLVLLCAHAVRYPPTSDHRQCIHWRYVILCVIQSSSFLIVRKYNCF